MEFNSSNQPFHMFEPTQKRWYWAVRVLLALVTIIGNAPLVYVIVTRRKLRQNLSNRFILSLNVADLCVGLFVSPSEFVCTYWLVCARNFQLAMYEFFTYTSSLCLCVVTWDRYKSVTRPLTYPVLITVKQYLVPILLCWLLPLLVTLLHFTYLVNDGKTASTAMKILTAFETVLFFAAPCLILPLVYLRIVCIIRRHKECEKRQKDQVDFNYSTAMSETDDVLRISDSATTAGHKTSVHSMGPNNEMLREGIDSDVERSTEGRKVPQETQQRHPNHDCAITVLGLIIVLFVASTIFGAYLHFKESFISGFIIMMHSAMDLSWLLLLSNSALNPFVYGLVKRDIKIELKKLFTRRKYRR